MGNSEIEEPNELFSYTKIFEQECPFYMSIGMSYDEFWYGDCWVASYYREAWKLKKQQLNEQFWLQGVYIYEALIDVAPILHAFTKKGTKPLPFPEKPYDLYKDSEQSKKKKKQEEENEKIRAELFLKQWVKDTAKRF